MGLWTRAWSLWRAPGAAKPTSYGETTSVERVKDLGSSGTIYGGSCPFTEGLVAWEQGQERDGSLEHLNQAICSVFHNWEGRGQIANDKQLIQSPAGTMLIRLLAPYSYEKRGLGIHTHTHTHTHTRERTHTLLFCYVCFHYHWKSILPLNNTIACWII